MLVLTRKPLESIHIDGPATIRILRAAGGKVKIGIEAENHVRVIRGELNDKIQEGGKGE